MTVDKFSLSMTCNLKSVLERLEDEGERLSNKLLTKITSPIKIISAKERGGNLSQAQENKYPKTYPSFISAAILTAATFKSN